MKFKIFLENEENEKIEKLGNQLKYIDNTKYNILGHGTNQFSAKNIINTGLKYSQPDLNRQAIELFHSREPIEKQIDSLKLILNWTHKQSKYIVLIAIPHPTEDVNYNHHMQGVWEKIPKHKRTNPDGTPTENTTIKYVIKSEFLLGYVDANTATFYPNNNFNPPPIETKNKWWANHQDAHPADKYRLKRPQPENANKPSSPSRPSSPSPQGEDVW